MRKLKFWNKDWAVIVLFVIYVLLGIGIMLM